MGDVIPFAGPKRKRAVNRRELAEVIDFEEEADALRALYGRYDAEIWEQQQRHSAR